jgi:4-hydroxybenzoate polyprenyltransferase
MNRQPSRATAYLQLMRLPNVFTAVADVAMGYLITRGSLHPVNWFVALIGSSCALYLAGMVLNDVFDLDIDSRDRPQRPIPSGRVPFATAKRLGWSLLGIGVTIGWVAGLSTGHWRPGVIATLLAICVVLYDWILKKTVLAPVLMGACRMSNVLLGMSLSPYSWKVGEWLIACGIGIYIAGVTLFARTEARASSRVLLITGTVIMGDGIALLTSLPLWLDASSNLTLRIMPSVWFALWAVLALLILRRCVTAVVIPDPARVQAAVRNGVQSIIVIDAALCAGFAGPYWGIAIVLLAIPTFLLTQWLRAT